jgi:hypothetical protein
MWTTFVIYQKLLKANNHPKGNLVTLLITQQADHAARGQFFK